MANWSLPTLADLYVNFRQYLSDRLDDTAKMFDSATTSPTNLPTGTKRWNSTLSCWQTWSGSAWGYMAPSNWYGINITGTAGACSGTANYANAAGSLTAGNDYTVNNLTVNGSVIIGSSGSYQPGAIYSDTNWGMLFRAKQASPVLGDFVWFDAGGTELFRYAGGVLSASTSGNAATATGAKPDQQFQAPQGVTGFTNSSGFGVRVAGRASDNISLIQFTNNAQTVQYGAIQGDATGHLQLFPASGEAYCNGSRIITSANHPFGLGSDLGCTNLGSIVMCQCAAQTNPDDPIIGSSLYPAGLSLNIAGHVYLASSASTLPGTWRCLGKSYYDNSVTYGCVSLFQRIA